MQDLKEFTILETFRTLDPDRQRALLEQLVVETKLASITVKFEKPEHERFWEFLRKQWPKMSLEFFRESLRRWEILQEKSYGNDNISCCDVGDLYLQAESWEGKYKGARYDEFPIHDRVTFFYDEVLKECKWEYMWICKLEQGDELSTNYRIKDLMELTVEEFEQKMKEFKFL